MDAQNPKDLAKLIKLLRKNGVESFKTADFEIKLRSELPRKTSRTKQSDQIQTDQMSEEQILLWSSAASNFPMPGVV